MKYIIATFTLFLLLSACNKTEMADTTPKGEIQADVMVTAMNDFQWGLFQESVSQSESDANVLISPLSIAAALYLTLEGSAGETREELEKALAMEEISGQDLGEAFSELMTLIESSDDKTRFEWSNAIFWDSNRINPFEKFLDYTRTHFDARQEGMDFQHDSALTAINDWVNSATEGRIDKILEEISSEEVMFLINALYFIGDWDNPFPEEMTKDRIFTTSDGTQVQVPTMSQDAPYRFMQNEQYSAFEMPFSDTSFSMVFILPSEGMNMKDFIASFSSNDLEEVDRLLRKARVQIYLPRFEVLHSSMMNEVLKNLGIHKAFDRNEANFSNLGLAPEGNLYITKVNHEAFLKIDEKGAEGAAVTSIGIGVTSLPPTLRFDRPFVYLLKNKDTDVVIFAGKMENPLQTN